MCGYAPIGIPHSQGVIPLKQREVFMGKKLWDQQIRGKKQRMAQTERMFYLAFPALLPFSPISPGYYTNRLLRPRIWPSLRASSGVGPCHVLFKYASDPTPCGFPVVQPSTRSRDNNSSNIRANPDIAPPTRLHTPHRWFRQ